MPDSDILNELRASQKPLNNDEWLICWRLVAQTVSRAALDPDDPRFARIQQLLNALEYHYKHEKTEAFYHTFVRLHELLAHR